MAVTMFSGTVGSGKSLHTARDIKEKLRWGRNVISTVNIDTTLCFMNKIQEWVFNITRGKKHYYIEDVRQKNFYYIETCEIEVKHFAQKHHGTFGVFYLADFWWSVHRLHFLAR